MSYRIPQVQRAAFLTCAGGDLTIKSDHPVIQPSELLPGQCLVKLSHSGVCHSDLSIRHDHYAIQCKSNLVGGHEGIGTVVAIGNGTTKTSVKVGDRVGITFMGESCLECEMCMKGHEAQCHNLKSCGYQIDGTFQEYAIAYVSHVVPIPDSLDSAAAAGLLCAGFTVYMALRDSETHVGDWVVISGAGGGLGHLAVQYAVAMGLRVIAVDTGEDKKTFCLKLGAEKWIDFKESKDVAQDIIDIADGLGAHAAIVAAASSSAYETAASYLRRKGYLMVVGLPPHSLLSVPILLVAVKCLTIRGVFIGNRQDIREAVALAAAGKVSCFHTIRGLSELETVYDEMEHGKVVGRVVLDISK
ncbi:mannitol-1-phosphate dehydrogenase MPDH1 [Schizopora paradoxa]|uniref:alcohol dehydrogenase n=1 Tax=Schizopora paradoxa TaxID=27342 RepID=A0A0H2S5F8_9AGAM|nr:mannitol-1-phosphate dehydrogenase MPDH1 [Schizopora paradoxa]